MNHPVHLHGHSFQVVKIGWPQYHENGTIAGPNKDLMCIGDATCNNATWAQSSWTLGRIEDMIQHSPPLKDTILVPSQGYVVIRLIMDNPGMRLWYIMCILAVVSITNLDSS